LALFANSGLVRIPRNDLRIAPMNHPLHYFAKTLGAVLPLLGG